MMDYHSSMTDAQEHLTAALDDMAEHVAWEFEPDQFDGISTIGFAHIHGIDGRSSFVQRAKSLADKETVGWVRRNRRDNVIIEIGPLDLRLAPAHDGGYRLSITNINELRPGPEHQRLDVRERLHWLVLERLQYEWGYLDGARVKSRMD
jgi:hypothetical protein